MREQTAAALPAINAIIVNWRSSPQVERCATRLFQARGVELRLYVVDNFSTAEERLAVEQVVGRLQRLGEVTLVPCPDNRGYCGGNNAAFSLIRERGQGGHVLVINPDVELDEWALPRMAGALASGLALVSPVMLDHSGAFLHGAITLRGYMQRPQARGSDAVQATDVCQGACLLLDESALATEGTLFDDRFFMYWDEVDLCLRLRERQLRIGVATQATGVREHNAPGRAALMFYYSVRNAWLIRELHPARFTLAQYLVYLAWILALTLKFAMQPRQFLAVLRLVARAVVDARARRHGRLHA